MRKQPLRELLRKCLALLRRFVFFFALMGFVVTCSILLFTNAMHLDIALLRENALLTFLNILLLTVLFVVLDAIRRHFTVDRPVQRILTALERITKGDFSARIEPFRAYESKRQFGEIVEGCNKMAAELAGLETLRTDFVANVSHELKTPLAIMQNYGTMLQEPELSEEKRIEYAKAITGASRRLADLISNILKLNRLENQQIFPAKTDLNLSEQLCECLLGFEEAWEEKRLDIETDFAEDVHIQTDAELLVLVWNNLFSNAVKFTPPGGKLTVTLKRKDGFAVVTVTDTGCGMNPEVGAHIFEKFYQGDASHATQGNGLGLALVKRVVDITGSEIAVESVPGAGSSFTVRLKVNVDE